MASDADDDDDDDLDDNFLGTLLERLLVPVTREERDVSA